MPEGFERFTDRARRVLAVARQEAQRLQHPWVESEHLLLGLMAEGEGAAVRVLSRLGVATGDLRVAVERALRRGDRPVEGEPRLAPRIERALELAAGEAKRLGHSSVGTGHLLLGLLREGGGIAGQALTAAGITLDRAREATVAVLAQAPQRKARVKRYNLVMPEELFRDLQDFADRRHTTVVEVMRRFLRLGLVVGQACETPGSAVVIRENDREREVLLV